MKLIELWGSDGTLEVEIVLINNVGIDRYVAALWGEGYSVKNLSKGVVGMYVIFERDVPRDEPCAWLAKVGVSLRGND